MSKFMQSLGDSAYRKLRRVAQERDITVQELIRAIVIPDWLEATQRRNEEKGQSRRRRKRVSRSRRRIPVAAMTVGLRPKKKQ